MSLGSEYLLYLTAFRLGILAAGIISIFLGYKLFVRGIFSSDTSARETVVEAKMVGSKFRLKNAAPGTGFGLFGMILIVTMIIQGRPELVYENFKRLAEDNQINSVKLTMRGQGDSDQVPMLLEQAIQYERSDDFSKAIKSYKNILMRDTVPLNQLAWLYFKEDKLDDALPPARLAVDLNPNNPAVVDTQAQILAKQENRAKAKKIIQKDSRSR